MVDRWAGSLDVLVNAAGRAYRDLLGEPPATWADRAAVVTSGAGWFQSDDGTDSVWVAGTYKEIIFHITGDDAWFWLGTADPTVGLFLPQDCPLRLAIPLDALDVFIKRAAATEVTLHYVLLPY